jgi:hypothetical protein
MSEPKHPDEFGYTEDGYREWKREHDASGVAEAELAIAAAQVRQYQREVERLRLALTVAELERNAFRKAVEDEAAQHPENAELMLTIIRAARAAVSPV